MSKFLLKISAFILTLTIPLAVFAANDVQISGPTNFSLLTADTAVATILLAPTAGQQVSSMSVQSNYIDITLDNLSVITLNVTASNRFIRVSYQSGSNAYTVSPACPTTTVTLNGTGAQVVLRVQVFTTNNCVTPPSGGGGGGGGYTPPPPPPPIFTTDNSVLINNDQASTASLFVSLHLKSTNATSVMISNNQNFTGATWQSFTDPTDLSWTLTSGDGTKTVYVMFRSGDGTLSAVASDSIQLNTTFVPPPTTPPTSFQATGTYGVDLALANSPTINIDRGYTLAVGMEQLCISGSLIKLPSDNNPLTQYDSTVYYCGADGYRHAFPDEGTYFSWYKDFSNILIVSAQLMASIPLGSNVTYRPGSWLVKFNTDPKVYAIAQNAVLRWVVDEATAIALYGYNWGAKVKDISDAFYTNYTFGDPITLADVIPGNTLVQFTENTGCTTAGQFISFLGPNEGASSEVRDLQILLKCLGYFPADTDASAIYGPITTTAVKKFQQYHNIPQTGVVDAVTRDALNVYSVPASTASAPAPAPTTACTTSTTFTEFLTIGTISSEVLPLQVLLQCLGYFPADVTPNGTYGTTTESAVKKFQTYFGIDAVGYVGPSTREKLNTYTK